MVLLAIASVLTLVIAKAQQASSPICSSSSISHTELLNTTSNGGTPIPFFGGEGAEIALDPANKVLYFAENPFLGQGGIDTVVQMPLSGGHPVSIAPAAPGFGDVTALAFHNRRLYVADGIGYLNTLAPWPQPTAHNVVWQFDPSNPDSWTRVVNGINNPTGLAFDGKGSLYISSWNDQKVYEYKHVEGTTGFTLSKPVWTAPDPSDAPYGLAVDKNNNLYIAGFGVQYNTGSKIFKVNSTGNSTVFFDSSTAPAAFFPSGPNEPTSLAFDSNGYLYAVYYNALKIVRIAPDGSYVVFPGGGTADDAGNGIVITPHGDVITVVNGGRSTSDPNPAVVAIHGLTPCRVHDSDDR